MKTKVAILEQDENYIRRLMNSFQTMYADKLELNIFSSLNQLYEGLKEENFDVILADEKIDVDRERIPRGIGLAYLCESVSVEEIRGIPAVCKYQRADLIYKQILGLREELMEDRKFKTEGAISKTVLFLSAQGGAGTSSAAAAFALRQSKDGRKVFYLNLECMGTADLYFQDEGNMNFSEVIYNLKMKRSNFLLKLESLMKTDKSEVDFFSSCSDANDMQELKDEEIARLLEGVSQMRAYDYLIIDISGDYNKRINYLMSELASQIVYVCDGSETGFIKLKRFCDVVKREEENSGQAILRKAVILYNRCENTVLQLPESVRLPQAGSISEKSEGETRKLIEMMSNEEAIKHL